MKRSKFSLSHYKLLSCDMGWLVPIGLTEVLPGDTIQQATSLLVRVSPLLAPVMHPVHVRVHHWFVPFRLIWDDWEDFITGGPDGMDTSAFPTQNVTVAQGDLLDYLGVPPGFATQTSILPVRAYNLIWNNFYRDQDLQAEIPISMASGNDATTERAMRQVNWEKDYFTLARPWPQKGPEITLPISGLAPVIRTPGGPPNGQVLLAHTAGLTQITGQDTTTASPDRDLRHSLNISGAQVGPFYWGEPTGLTADMSAVSAVNINDLREAFALQRYQEARARYGSRYVEYLRYLGVRPSDARLQLPEYLGGGKQVIQFSEVLQTAPDPVDPSASAVGDIKGHGIGAMRSNRYRRFFEENGYILSLLSVKPKTMYAQALPRTWNRRVKEDFFQRELQHIGQQEVLNKEIFAMHGNPDGVFGYQDRYDEYRRAESSIAGDFRTTLDHWHYARIFSGPPALNSDFVAASPTKRVNAVPLEHVLWIMANHSIQARRLVARQASSFIS